VDTSAPSVDNAAFVVVDGMAVVVERTVLVSRLVITLVDIVDCLLDVVDIVDCFVDTVLAVDVELLVVVDRDFDVNVKSRDVKSNRTYLMHSMS